MPEPPDRPEPPDLRAGDDDREITAEALRVAAGEGRLTLGELEERLDAAYAARTYGELARVTADLPDAPLPVVRPVPAAPALPGANVPTEHLTAVFGEERRQGRWEVPERVRARSVFGSVEIDLTDAIVRHRAIEIDAWAVFGSVEIWVPEGVDVQMRPGVSAFGSRHSNVPVGDAVPSVTLFVSGGAAFGSVEVKPRKRPLRERLHDWGLR